MLHGFADDFRAACAWKKIFFILAGLIAAVACYGFVTQALIPLIANVLFPKMVHALATFVQDIFEGVIIYAFIMMFTLLFFPNMGKKLWEISKKILHFALAVVDRLFGFLIGLVRKQPKKKSKKS